MLPVFRDLLKPQWLTVIETLKTHGGMPVADLSRLTGVSYMTLKKSCEDLTRAGYLTRTRLPRREVGRPEIFYSLAAKADALFPQAGPELTLELLGILRQMHGESAPEKLLFQYFAKQSEALVKQLSGIDALPARAAKLAALRTKAGCDSRCEESDGPPRIVERHNPLRRIIEAHPRAAAMEQRMLEQALGTRLLRREIPTGRESAPQVVFELG
jgi:predicted ArsR family transcriptional regulator